MKPKKFSKAALIAFAAGLVISSASAADIEESARVYRQENARAILLDFFEFLRIPNPTDSPDDLARNADALAARINALGASTVELLQSDGAPMVYAEFPGANPDIVLGLYSHYDGVPVNAELWTSPPFEPTLFDGVAGQGGERRPFPESGAPPEDWRIYARAAADAKAPIFAILEAIRAAKNDGAALPFTVRLFFDGQEESGSPDLLSIRAAHAPLFDSVDSWVFVDGPMHASGRPTLVLGARGVTNADLTVYGANKPLHSGHYGNWAPSATSKLVRLLDQMQEEAASGGIKPYAQRPVLSKSERRAISDLSSYDGGLQKEYGLAETVNPGEPLYLSIMRPSLTITGLSAGLETGAPRNVIPSVAHAYLESRLTPGVDAEQVCAAQRNFIERKGFHLVDGLPTEEQRLRYPNIANLECRLMDYPGRRLPLDEPFAQALFSALAEMSGATPLVVPMSGGSLPLAKIAGQTDAPVAVIPVVNYDDNQHAPNENLIVGNLWYAIDAMAAVLSLAPSEIERP